MAPGAYPCPLNQITHDTPTRLLQI